MKKRNIRGGDRADTYAKQIIEEISAASGCYNMCIVFSDFCRATAIALESPCAKSLGEFARHEKLEHDYAVIAEKYGKDMDHFAKALAITVDALEDLRTDVLGHVLEALNATNKNFGQFFTPVCVSRMMSNIALADIKPVRGRVITVNDPACGAGVLLIEGANAFIANGGRKEDLMLYASDIDETAANIVFIQLSLLGFAARVTRLDALSMCGDEPRYTLCYYQYWMKWRLA